MMSSNVKNVLFGAKQEAVLTPKVGYEVEAVEVFNKTTNEIVPSHLEKTSDNPPQWTLSFEQPAGLVSIRPKMRPILYSVVIEECENCSIVLLEYDDAVDIKVGSPVFGGNTEATQQDNEDGSVEDKGTGSSYPNGNETEEGVNFNMPQHSDDNVGHSEPNSNVEGTDASETELSVQSDDNSEVPEEEMQNTDFNKEVVSNDEGSNEVFEYTEQDVGSPELDETHVEDEAGVHDSIYDAGEFEKDLEEVEPEVISSKTLEDKYSLFWQYRKAFDAGQISKEKFLEVQGKHTKFLDDISSGRIVVRD